MVVLTFFLINGNFLDEVILKVFVAFGYKKTTKNSAT